MFRPVESPWLDPVPEFKSCLWPEMTDQKAIAILSRAEERFQAQGRHRSRPIAVCWPVLTFVGGVVLRCVSTGPNGWQFQDAVGSVEKGFHVQTASTSKLLSWHQLHKMFAILPSKDRK